MSRLVSGSAASLGKRPASWALAPHLISGFPARSQESGTQIRTQHTERYTHVATRQTKHPSEHMDTAQRREIGNRAYGYATTPSMALTIALVITAAWCPR